MSTGPTGVAGIAASDGATATELEILKSHRQAERHATRLGVPVAPRKTNGASDIVPFPIGGAGNEPVDTGIMEAFAALTKAPKIEVPSPSGSASTEQITMLQPRPDAGQVKQGGTNLSKCDHATASVAFRDCNPRGRPKPTLANAVIAIKALGIGAYFDKFHRRTNVTYQGDVSTIHEGLLTDHTVSAIRSLINNTYRIDCGDEKTLAAIQEIAWANAYDPVLDLLDDCQGKWDGRKRLDTWVIHYLGCEDTPLNRAVGRNALIAACRRARHPGCKFDNITVLEGVEGTNKSTAIRVLAGDENFSDQSIIGASDKDVQEQLEGVWMHENADLAGMKRADVEHVKAFASRQVDRARPAYGRVREDRPRRSIEWGTTNNNEYLLSQTGNRRFWPLASGKIDLEALRADRKQLLGEAATYEAAGESITLDKRLWGDAGKAQEKRRVVDPWEDILDHMPDSVTVYEGGYQSRTVTIIHRAGDGYERAASADVLLHVLRISAAHQNSSHGQRLAHAMARVGWERNKSGLVTINGQPARGYIRRDSSLPVGASSKSQMGAHQPGDIGAQAAMASDVKQTAVPDKGGLADVSPVEAPPTDTLEQGLAQRRAQPQAAIKGD